MNTEGKKDINQFRDSSLTDTRHNSERWSCCKANSVTSEAKETVLKKKDVAKKEEWDLLSAQNKMARIFHSAHGAFTRSINCQLGRVLLVSFHGSICIIFSEDAQWSMSFLWRQIWRLTHPCMCVHI